tara:strand:+ start:37598 stop:38269 length:672 start_codon:yes stop_codon:yes gene_type:complete
MNKLIVKKTGDGSSTIHNTKLDENYHSTYGALQEAVHVFIENGLKKTISNFKSSNRLDILEVGFGTGLNCFLSLKYALSKKQNINYTGIECYPLDFEILNQLNYALSNNEKIMFDDLHLSKWGELINITPNFKLTKLNIKFQNFISENKFHVIYFDAFGPRVEKFLWHIDVFRQCFQLLYYGGSLVTYCAKGQVRRDLISSGFKVERLQGPPGKREMLRAVKK